MRRVLVERNRYVDSVFLMRIGLQLEALDGVSHATVAMGTPANLDNLAAVGFAFDDRGPITPQDLLLALDVDTEEDVAAAHARLEELLAGAAPSDRTTKVRPASLAEAIEIDPTLNLALISVPGAYAAREARKALHQGLHVMLFSDNVSIQDEIALKEDAIGRGLLMMGPDCGTAILNGVPLGFANVCRAGAVGLVGASGTGIQEIASLVHRHGGGLSQAIGTGGRDLSAAVDARMTRFGIDALAADPRTEVIVVVSKTPAPEVGNRVIEALAEAGKPGVVSFVGGERRNPAGDILFAETLADAALLACRAIDVRLPERSTTGASAQAGTPSYPSPGGRLVGLFCGGTLCQEAWNLMDRGGFDVRSNVAGDPAKRVHPEEPIDGHVLWDLGDDAFTVGKPHPMIAPSLRDDEVVRSGEDPSVGLLLVDCVLGYGAHEDPAGSLAEASRAALADAQARGSELSIVASVTGTDEDPQRRRSQVETLVAAGVVVADSNADAARLAMTRLEGGTP